MLNHSCWPSGVAVAAGGAVQVTAVADVKVGGEVSLAYVGVWAPREARRTQLYEAFRLECSCPRCAGDLNVPLDGAPHSGKDAAVAEVLRAFDGLQQTFAAARLQPAEQWAAPGGRRSELRQWLESGEGLLSPYSYERRSALEELACGEAKRGFAQEAQEPLEALLGSYDGACPATWPDRAALHLLYACVRCVAGDGAGADDHLARARAQYRGARLWLQEDEEVRAAESEAVLYAHREDGGLGGGRVNCFVLALCEAKGGVGAMALPEGSETARYMRETYGEARLPPVWKPGAKEARERAHEAAAAVEAVKMEG